MATGKKNKKSGDTLYHILFWIIVIAIFPVSLSVWFYRTKRFDFNKRLRAIIITVFWAVVAILLAAGIWASSSHKKNQEAKESSRQEASRSSEQEASQSSYISSSEEEDNSELKITVFDMNQADAILVECDEHYMVIDSGDMSSQLSARLFEAEPDLKEIDYIVASTPYNESVGGFSRALPYYNVGKAFCSVTEYDSEKFKDFKEALEAVSLEVPRIGQTLDLGSAKVTFLGPNAESEDIGSIILKIEHKDKVFLFCGSAAAEDLEYLSGSGYDIDCDLIKVGGHGAEGALSAKVMEKTTPDYAVISSGSGYGCPSAETILYLSNAKVETYRTDLQGSIKITSNADDVKFEVTGDQDADTTSVEADATLPEDTQPEETQPEETQPEEVQPEEVQPEDTQPEEVQPEETQPVETAPEEAPEEAVPDENGYTYAKKVSDNYFHRLDCPEIAGMTYPEIEKYSVSRATIMDEWRILIPCPVCNP